LFVMMIVGKPDDAVMEMLAVLVQPFAAVPVTVYVPAEVIVAEALLPNPLLQLYVDPPVAVTLIEVVVHVNSVAPVLFVIAIIGKLDDAEMVIWAVFEHPLAAVPVTVYVPAAVILAEALLPNPLLQLYDTPPVAVTLIVVVVQVNSVGTVLLVISIVGCTLFCVIVILAVLVHPFAAVPVTVYVPAEVIAATALFPSPLLQTYVEAPVAVTPMEVVVHDNSVDPELLVISTVGEVEF